MTANKKELGERTLIGLTLLCFGIYIPLKSFAPNLYLAWMLLLGALTLAVLPVYFSLQKPGWYKVIVYLCFIGLPLKVYLDLFGIPGGSYAHDVYEWGMVLGSIILARSGRKSFQTDPNYSKFAYATGFMLLFKAILEFAFIPTFWITLILLIASSIPLSKGFGKGQKALGFIKLAFIIAVIDTVVILTRLLNFLF